MKPLKPMTPEIREKIQQYIKSGIDISPLIADRICRGENFRGAIIKEFSRLGDDFSGCNFENARIGEVGKTSNISGSKICNCNFKNTEFYGTILGRKVDARGANFENTYFEYIDYRLADFRGATFCNTTLTFGWSVGAGAKFDQNFFVELSKLLGFKVTPPTE